MVDCGRRFPDFFIVGPPRTGTTWLSRVLRGHVILPRGNKETWFFDRHYSKGESWYLSHFECPRPDKPIGEIAPTYFYSSEARVLIARHVPRAKIICILREPVERLYSFYKMKRSYASMPMTFAEAIKGSSELLESARYGHHVSEWFKLFGRERVLVLIYEDLARDPQAFVDRVVHFIGASRFRLSERDQFHEHSSDAMVQPANYAWTRVGVVMAEALQSLRLTSLTAVLKRLGLKRIFIGRGMRFPQLDRRTEEELRKRFIPEIEAIENLIGRELSVWRFSTPQ